MQVSDLGDLSPFWSRDGSALFYIRGNRIIEAVVENAAKPRLSQPREVVRHAGADITVE